MFDHFRQSYLPRPMVQLFCSSVVLFANPGLYGSITGLGAGGGKPTSAEVGSITNCALYGVYTVVSLMVGPVINLLGPKWAAALGSVTYPLYAAGLWIYSDTDNTVPPIFFGALCGVGAGILWPTASYMCYAYSTESEKALFFSIQWTMVAVGSSIGAFIAFGYNFHETEATGTPVAVYIIFIVIMLLGTLFSFFTTLRPDEVRRKDGRAIALFEPTSFKQEVAGLMEMYKNWKVMTIFPIAMGAEITLSLCSSLSSHWYNLRTRCLVSVVFWLIQIPSTFALKWILARPVRRRTQAMYGIAFLFIVTSCAWIAEFLFLTRKNVLREQTPPAIDWSSPASDVAPHFLAYGIFFGIIYANWQGLGQWLVATMSNDPQVVARYSGVFKAGCSAGMCISFGVDGAGVAYLTEAIWECILEYIGLALMVLIALVAVTDTNYFQEKNELQQHVTEVNLEAASADDRKLAEEVSK
ncbi:hypothetical protein IAR55_004217 [Kwoniella newhampshirensis]|uniref:Uncharacterized protein n=1 Tax=Kwoniella newhampshirensis TaxID=1651941 RepID=A0AAW0YWJ3_9TREE